MSSRSRPSEAARTAASTRSATASGGSPAHVFSRSDELAVAEDLLAAAPDLGDAVGVEHEHVARLELDRDVGEQRVDVGAEQRAEAADGLDACRRGARPAAAGARRRRARGRTCSPPTRRWA